MTLLGQKVRELRLSRQITQQVLANEATVSHSLITALETGRRRYISAPEVERLAMALEVPAEEFWGLIPGGKRDARYIALSAY